MAFIDQVPYVPRQMNISLRDYCSSASKEGIQHNSWGSHIQCGQIVEAMCSEHSRGGQRGPQSLFFSMV